MGLAGLFFSQTAEFAESAEESQRGKKRNNSGLRFCSVREKNEKEGVKPFPNSDSTPIIGLPCWNVKPGHGTFLTLEFGEPREFVQEPIAVPRASKAVQEYLGRRHVYVHGEWHLWIYCCKWRVQRGDKVVGFSDLEGSTKHWMENAAHALEGKTLTGVSIDTDRVTSVFTFTEDMRLETDPYDELSEQWKLFLPDGWVLCYEADGTLKRVHGSESS